MYSNEGLKIKIGIIGNDEKKPASNFKVLTLEKLYLWIDAKTIDQPLKEELKKMASNYPQQALVNWQKKYSFHLSKAKNKLKSVDVYKKPEELGEL